MQKVTRKSVGAKAKKETQLLSEENKLFNFQLYIQRKHVKTKSLL